MASSARPIALPTGRAGRALAVGITVLLLLLLWEVLGSPLVGMFQDRATSLEGRRAVADRMQALASQLPALRRVAEVDANRSGPVALIAGGSDAIAGAALQEKVQQMASSLGATLSSSESLPASQAGAYRRVGVRISISASFEVMVRLIAAIEQGSPSMLIDDLQLHGSRIQLLATAPLEGAMTVLAFRQGDAPGSAPAAAPDPSAAGDP